MTCFEHIPLGPSEADRDRWARQSAAAMEKQLDAAVAPKRQKFVHVGAPACFALELACQDLARAFGTNCYLVGSALDRPDWRDVDVRLILSDMEFDKLFPSGCRATGSWEFDARWLVMTTAISSWLRERTGLPIDFQFQPQTHANERHSGRRNALGLRFAPENTGQAEEVK